MEFTKGYMLEDGQFIQESEMVKVALVNGEIVDGVLLKPAKKEFRIIVKDVIRVLKVAEVVSMELFVENE